MKTKKMSVAIMVLSMVGWSYAEGWISLSMSVPDGPLLSDEDFQAVVTVTNSSTEVFGVYTNALDVMRRGQLVFDYDTRAPAEEIERFKTSRLGWYSNEGSAAMIEVRPGTAFSWNISEMMISYTCAYYQASNISCRLMVRDGRWIASPKYPVNVLEKMVEDVGVLKFSGEYVLRDGRVSTLRVYVVELGTASYLFTESGTRLCRLPPDAQPSFQMDREPAVLTVTEPSFAQPVRFFPSTMKIER